MHNTPSVAMPTRIHYWGTAEGSMLLRFIETVILRLQQRKNFGDLTDTHTIAGEAIRVQEISIVTQTLVATNGVAAVLRTVVCVLHTLINIWKEMKQ